MTKADARAVGLLGCAGFVAISILLIVGAYTLWSDRSAPSPPGPANVAGIIVPGSRAEARRSGLTICEPVDRHGQACRRGPFSFLGAPAESARVDLGWSGAEPHHPATLRYDQVDLFMAATAVTGLEARIGAGGWRRDDSFSRRSFWYHAGVPASIVIEAYPDAGAPRVKLLHATPEEAADAIARIDLSPAR